MIAEDKCRRDSQLPAFITILVPIPRVRILSVTHKSATVIIMPGMLIL